MCEYRHADFMSMKRLAASLDLKDANKEEETKRNHEKNGVGYLVEKAAAADGSFDGVPGLGQHGAVHTAPGVHHAGQTPKPPEAARQRDRGVLPGPTGMEQAEIARMRKRERQ